MDQEKIGKFIYEIRKEKGLTQEQLAEKLNVSSKSVSRWENGRNMPDFSLLLPLCQELGVTINELLYGERIKKEEYREKAEENIIKTIKYTNKRTKMFVKKGVLTIGILLAIILVVLGMFVVDFNKMMNQEPVIFSTWGFKYIPPVNLNDELIENEIRNYLVTKGDNDNKHHLDEKTFVSFKTYLIQEKKDSVSVYSWVLQNKYYLKDNDPVKDSGFSIPHKFVLKKDKEGYLVVSSEYPRDGSYYVDDMKRLFPYTVRKEMDNVHYDGTIDKLELDIKRQVNLYFHK